MTEPDDSELALPMPLAVGLGLSLYFAVSPESELRLVETYELFVERYRAKLRSFWEDDTGKCRPFGAKEEAFPRRRLRRKDKKSIFWGASAADTDKVASWWKTKVLIDRSEYGHPGMSGLLCAVSPGLGLGEFLPLVFALVDTAAPNYGAGGYHILEPLNVMERQEARPLVKACASRFHGLGVEDQIRVSIDGTDGIAQVNWLTVLDHDLVGRLGGAAALRKRFSNDIVLHERANALIIQAGPSPSVGDVNRVDELAHYREVARALRPIFSAKMRNFLSLYPDTNAWRFRFEEGARWPP